LSSEEGKREREKKRKPGPGRALETVSESKKIKKLELPAVPVKSHGTGKQQKGKLRRKMARHRTDGG